MAVNLICADPEQEACHGHGGLILVRLVDPLSQLISSAVNLPFHAVGFYYREQLRPKYNTILFNTYDNRYVPWLPTGSSLRRLYTAAPVEQIICYPLVDPQKSAQFRAAVVEVVNVNSTHLIEPAASYNHLLQHVYLNNHEPLVEPFITGYTLANKVLLKLDPGEALSFVDSDPAHLAERLASSIYKSKSLNRPVSLRILSTASVDLDLIYTDMSIFYQTVGDLIQNNNTFRAAILNRPLIQSSVAPPPQVVEPNITALCDLGKNLDLMVDIWDQADTPIIDLGCILSTFNRAVEGTIVPQIRASRPEEYMTTLSREVILTMPGVEDTSMGSDVVVIPTHYPNLSGLSRTQLMDLLVYIDSLSSGHKSVETYDGGGRYAGLQNKIVHELALRGQDDGPSNECD